MSGRHWELSDWLLDWLVNYILWQMFFLFSTSAPVCISVPFLLVPPLAIPSLDSNSTLTRDQCKLFSMRTKHTQQQKQTRNRSNNTADSKKPLINDTWCRLSHFFSSPFIILILQIQFTLGTGRQRLKKKCFKQRTEIK